MEKTFTVDAKGMAECQAFLETFCEEPKPAIILDEIVSNIVRCSGATAFSLAYERADNGELTMILSDDGCEFDPTGEPPPDLSTDVEHREIGGLGIFMVKKMSKSVRYRRENGKNVLTVVI